MPIIGRLEPSAAEDSRDMIPTPGDIGLGILLKTGMAMEFGQTTVCRRGEFFQMVMATPDSLNVNGVE
jgi:hypothetical protein